MSDEQKPEPEPQPSKSPPRPPRGPTIATGFGDDDDDAKKRRKKEIVRINLPPKPSAAPTIKFSPKKK